MASRFEVQIRIGDHWEPIKMCDKLQYARDAFKLCVTEDATARVVEVMNQHDSSFRDSPPVHATADRTT